MIGSSGFPYWRISGYYFFYFAGLGAFLPYWGLYLESRHHSPEQIGQIMALVAGTKIVAPSLCGWLADRTGRGVGLIRLAGFLTFAAFAGFFWPQTFNGLLWTTLCFSFFWNACLPLFEALTLGYLGANAHRYTRVRIWGSTGFIVSVALLGYGFRARLSIDCLPWLFWGLLLALWLVSLSVPAARSAVEFDGQRFWPIVWRKEVLAFFFVVMLLQMSHGPYYGFFSIYLDEHDFAANQIGQLWALGVIAEIVLFTFIHRLFRCFSLREVLLTSLALAAVRWALVAWAGESLMALVTAQCLHAASFGASHAVGIQLTHKYFSGRHRSKGQGLYSSTSFGFGGAVGSWGAGVLWLRLGPESVYAVAALLCLFSWIIAWLWVDRVCTPTMARQPEPLS